MQVQAFKSEWEILHANIEKYERLSLLIKLVAVLVVVLSYNLFDNIWIMPILVLILWLQDGIWKTFQKRLEERILFIEKAMDGKTENNEQAFQFYSQWGDKRQGIVGLIKEYLGNSLKPTVAYPYVVLLALIPFI